jgi:hypothetical protein
LKLVGVGVPEGLPLALGDDPGESALGVDHPAGHLVGVRGDGLEGERGLLDVGSVDLRAGGGIGRRGVATKTPSGVSSSREWVCASVTAPA